MIICITGKTGSGKTTLLQILANKGYKVFETDAYIREIYKKDQIGYKAILNSFGNEYVNENEVDRKKLGKLVFNDRSKLDQLNQITLPIIRNKITELKKTNSLIFIELAIYLNYKETFEDLFDKVVLVKGSREIEENKLKELNWTKDNKNPIREVIDSNYIIVENNKTPEDLEEITIDLLKTLNI